jgi:DNA-binding GntR family transcriptional regulator
LWPPGKVGYHRVVITRGTPVPPYRQLAAILRGQIESGELAPGQQLPSVVKLAEDYEIAVPTVRKAISLLKAEGLVTGVAGYGTFVAEKQLRGRVGRG